MIGIIAGVAGVVGMLALWSLAWWLWKQAAVPPPGRADRLRRPTWPSEPTPGRTSPIPPPSWLFEDPDDDAPTARVHPSSDADTNPYTRSDMDCAGSLRERTDVLTEDPPPTGGKTCKLGLFGGPRVAGRE